MRQTFVTAVLNSFRTRSDIADAWYRDRWATTLLGAAVGSLVTSVFILGYFLGWWQAIWNWNWNSVIPAVIGRILVFIAILGILTYPVYRFIRWVGGRSV